MFKGINAAVIGSGKWGINHVKTAYGLLSENLRYVCDLNPDAGERIKSINSSIPFITDPQIIWDDNSINAVIIATPAFTHYEVAKNALEAGKNVLVEKPITLLSGEAKELVEIAAASGLNLMVGHVLLYHPAVVKLKQLCDENKIGKLQYIYSNRLNLGSIRTEENILWSFAPHDISIIQSLVNEYPVSINAMGADVFHNGIEDFTITFLKYKNDVYAHIFVSWLHPFKEHRLVVIGDKGMLVFEDSLPKDKLKFYEKGFSNVGGELQKFDSDFEVIEYENLQPLNEEQKHFFNSVLNNTTPITDGIHALEVLKILEAAQEKLKEKE